MPYSYQDYADLEASKALQQMAEAAAQAKYYDAQAAGVPANQALNQAKFEWQKVMDTAQMTGKFQGQWSNPQQQWFTSQFGSWFGAGGEPGAQAPGGGATTLQQQAQAYQQAFDLASQYGQYFAPGQSPNPGMATQNAIKQAQDIAAQTAGLTGWYQAPGVLNQAAGTAGATSLGTGYFVGGDHRIHQGAPGVNWGQAGWDPNTPGGGSGLQADPSWAVGTQVSDPSLLLKPAAEVTGGAAATGGAGAPGERVRTLAGLQEQRAAQAQQQSQTLNYLSLLSNLRGPADWAKYQQVLGSTPGGVRDLYAAAMGQYVPGGGATTGYQPQAASLQSLMGQVGGYNYGGQGGGQLGQPDVYNQNTQGVYQQGGGSQQVWGSGIGIGGQGLTPEQQAQATGNGTNMYGAQQQQYNLPAPNQIAAQSWNNMTPSQQQFFLGQYEAAGWDKGDVEALYKQALPRYATNSPTAGTWRMT